MRSRRRTSPASLPGCLRPATAACPDTCNCTATRRALRRTSKPPSRDTASRFRSPATDTKATSCTRISRRKRSPAMLEARSPELQAFLKAVYAGAEQLAAASREIGGVREIMDGFVGVFPVPEGVRVDPADCDGVPAEWLSPAEAAADRAILYMHGGCYISGSPGVVREFCGRLANASRTRILSIDYRLAPEHPFPAALEDALTCYRWLLEQGHDPTRIAVAGESAGGGLTLALLMQCRDLSLPMPACGVPISPWVDMELSFGESLTRNEGIDLAPVEPLRLGRAAYAGEKHLRNPLASPLYGDLSGLPPLLVQVGTREVLHDEGVEVARLAESAGVDVTLQRWEDMIHVWHWYASIFPEAQEAIEALGEWIAAHLPSSAAAA
ncbi:MAG: alpha/beta hydrolase [Gammaproteobacteria bacterium]|nr:alpha/beta hydrolase [Gammaproteobacteria bacterium]